MKKRLLKNLMFVMAMTILCFAVAMTASAETYTGECGLEGDNLTWTFDTETGVLTIDGEGEMDNYSIYNNINKTSAPWADYYSQMTELVIGENVTSIGAYAFYNCDTLASLEFSSTVKTIGEYAFYDCDSIDDVNFNEGLTSIGGYAFARCNNIADINFNEGLTSIGESAFLECDSIVDVNFNEGLTSIGARAFSGNRDLKNIKFGDGLTEISGYAFCDCTNLINIEWGTNLKKIGYNAFMNCDYCNLDIVIPDGVEYIGSQAFYGSPKSVSFPLSVKNIESTIFYAKNDKPVIIFYEGTVEQWEEISIDSYNSAIRNATFHFGHAHSYTSEITDAPTCLTTGIKTYTCDCGNTYIRELSALGHDVIIEPAVSATCSETGLTKGEYCTRCDYKVKQEETPSLGHDMINLEASEPTCTETGLTAGVACSRCDEISEGRQETVPALGHDIIIDFAVDATCTETGLTEGEHCSRCDYIVAQEETPALGHKEIFTSYIEPTCTEDGLSVGKECSVCGEVFIPAYVIPAKGHKLSNWIVTSKATCEKDGIKIKICSCGLTEEAVIPATGHVDADVDEKCDSCSASLTNESEKPSEPAEKDNVFSFLKSFLNNLIDFFRKLFGIK